MKDNIRASGVCKTWHEVAVSVRDRSPWLVYFNVDLSGVSYGFFDPREKKTTKAMKLSYLSFYARLCHSKRGDYSWYITMKMSNIVYVWDSHLNPDRPVKYSLSSRSFYKRHDGYCVESSSNNEMLHYAAWIEPPQNISIYDFPIIVL
ncbi:hypothetical protein Bca52824_001708 [Brassica carinata]|uniref:F-box domain-containing protein n=1 Tax=Brassica carinata TaxID=52824 RepID=A0A8X7WGK4_BRACI|nr:hypothetical protein Bca52824_001708 [Brassica carinata]